MKEKEEKFFQWPLVGNPKIPELLSQSIKNEKVAGSYIFLGPGNLGKTTLAKFFAQTLLCENRQKGDLVLPCNQCSSCGQMRGRAGEEDDLSVLHSDFYLTRRQEGKKNISVEQIREFIKRLQLSSFLNSYKIGVIKNAESLNLAAGNALLKTLEEPHDKVVVILIASHLENIPSTIVSRSRVLNFYPVTRDLIYDHLVNVYGARRSQAKNIAHLSLGRPALAVKFLQEEDFYKNYLDKGEIFLRLEKQNLNERIKEVSQMLSSSSGQENVDEVLEIIGIWRGLVRDFLLLNYSHKDLLQFEALKERLEFFERKFNPLSILKMIAILQKGEQQVKANVNPRLVLENTACNIFN